MIIPVFNGEKYFDRIWLAEKFLTASEVYTVLIHFEVALTSHKSKIWLISSRIKNEKMSSLEFNCKLKLKRNFVCAKANYLMHKIHYFSTFT